MPDLAAVLAGGVLAAGFCTLVGWPLARRAVPFLPALGVAPLLGWALLTALPWNGPIAWLGALACVCGAARIWPAPTEAHAMPWWLAGGAGLGAILPTAAILPKAAPDGVRLAGPMFDHAKVALVDALARLAPAVVNPFYGGSDAPARLAYYYWWHWSAAGLARALHVGGWTADAALTLVTAYASLMLMAAIGSALGGRWVALLAIGLALPGSLRGFSAGLERAGWLLPASGLGGWLTQASWAPQHLAAGGCVVVAALVVAGLGARWSGWGVAALAVLLAAGFGSSLWVGGVTAAIALPAAAAAVSWRGDAAGRVRLAVGGALAVAGALALAAPLLSAQLAAGRALGGGVPIRLALLPAFGPRLVGWGVLGPAVLMLIEFPVMASLGVIGAVRVAQRAAPPQAAPCWAAPGQAAPWQAAPWQAALLAVAGASAWVCWCARSTIENNDLGWRAIVPGLLVLIPCAASAAVAAWRRHGVRRWLVFVPVTAGLIGVAPVLQDNGAGQVVASPALAALAPAWAALRRVSGPADRVASDPALAASATAWPANIAWAVQADRSSCYAGWATARAFVPLPPRHLYATDRELRRVFDGAPAAGDLADLAGRLGCRFALITPGSPAWGHDPFAPAGPYRLIDAGADWRLYRAR